MSAPDDPNATVHFSARTNAPFEALVVKPAEVAATGSRQFDGLLDSIARLVTFLPRLLAALLRPLQNGLVQFYALGTVLGLTVFVLFVVFKVSR